VVVLLEMFVIAMVSYTCRAVFMSLYKPKIFLTPSKSLATVFMQNKSP